MKRIFFLLMAITQMLTATTSLSDAIQQRIRPIPDFPKPGIVFKDIGPLIADGALMQRITKQLAERYRDEGLDGILVLEARGFLFGAPLAVELGIPLIPVRKAGKLPGQVLSIEYEKEYGSDRFEIQKGLLAPHSRVLVIDDILATGGTAAAAIALAEKAEWDVVELTCIVEIDGLPGRETVKAPVHIVTDAPSQPKPYVGRRIRAEMVPVTVDGKELQRDLVTHPGAVVILPVLDDGKILMVKNYRYAVGEALWELPAGTLEVGEDPLTAAGRELEEECGYRTDTLRPLLSFYSSPGFCTEQLHGYQATGLQQTAQQLDDGEQISVHALTRDEIEALIAAGELKDAKSLIILQHYFRDLLPT